MTRTRITILLIALLIPLLASAVDINQELIKAAEKGDTAAVKALLDRGADVNAKDENGGTALMEAALLGNNATVQALLEAGADVNAKNKYGRTALMMAAAEGYTEIVELLKKAGARE